MMQALDLSTRCSRCDVVLSGREQFMGHMIHGHEMAFEQADALWKSTSMYISQKGTGDGKCYHR